MDNFNCFCFQKKNFQYFVAFTTYCLCQKFCFWRFPWQQQWEFSFNVKLRFGVFWKRVTKVEKQQYPLLYGVFSYDDKTLKLHFYSWKQAFPKILSRRLNFLCWISKFVERRLSHMKYRFFFVPWLGYKKLQLDFGACDCRKIGLPFSRQSARKFLHNPSCISVRRRGPRVAGSVPKSATADTFSDFQYYFGKGDQEKIPHKDSPRTTCVRIWHHLLGWHWPGRTQNTPRLLLRNQPSKVQTVFFLFKGKNFNVKLPKPFGSHARTFRAEGGC